MTSAGQLTKLERLCDALLYAEKYDMIDSTGVQSLPPAFVPGKRLYQRRQFLRWDSHGHWASLY